MVKTGLDVLVEESFARLKGCTVALLAAPASIDAQVDHIVDLCIKHEIKLKLLFGAEHGLYGNVQYMEGVQDSIDKKTGCSVISLYGNSLQSLKLNPELLQDVDVLVCDLQDIGSRYYTFCYSIAFAMAACEKAGVKCMVLDRPNPINGINIEGNRVLPEFKSFVGEYPLANRHALTLGELALFFNSFDKLSCDLEVVWMHGYERGMYFSDTKLPWVMTSPNMTSPETALVYPGACLFEGTNLSEGRGTTRPFELIGAPFIDDPDYFAKTVLENDLSGVALRPCYFTPTWNKHAGQLCAGVQIHVTDKQTFRPLKTSMSILWAAMKYDGFDWNRERYEFVSDRLAIDLLFGDSSPRKILENGGNVRDIESSFSESNREYSSVRQNFLRY